MNIFGLFKKKPPESETWGLDDEVIEEAPTVSWGTDDTFVSDTSVDWGLDDEVVGEEAVIEEPKGPGPFQKIVSGVKETAKSIYSKIKEEGAYQPPPESGEYQPSPTGEPVPPDYMEFITAMAGDPEVEPSAVQPYEPGQIEQYGGEGGIYEEGTIPTRQPVPSTPLAASIHGAFKTIPGLSLEGVDIEQLEREHGGSIVAGQMAGNVGAAMAGGMGVANILGKSAIAKSPVLFKTLSRVIPAMALRGGQSAEDVIKGKVDIQSALYNTLIESGGGAAFSIIPEIIFPPGIAQLITQPLADVIYQSGIDITRGDENVLSKEWFKQQIPTIAMAAGFSIVDIASGERFVAEQQAQRAEINKWFKGKGSEGFEIVKTPEGPLVRKGKVEEIIESQKAIEKAKEPPSKKIPVKEEGKFDVLYTKEGIPIEMGKGYKPTPEEIGKLPVPGEPEGPSKPVEALEPEGVSKVPSEIEPVKEAGALAPEVAKKAPTQEDVDKLKQPLKIAAEEIPGKMEEVSPGKKSIEKTFKKIKGTKKERDITPLEKAEEHITHTPRKKQRETNFLTGLEKLYTREKNLALPIEKLQKIAKKEGVKIPEDADLNYRIDRVRGSGGISKQFMDDNLKPIMKDINKMSPRKAGKIARNLEKYLMAKRQVWLYENKTGYVDAAFSKSDAVQVVKQFEGGEIENSDLILSKAKQIWGYTEKLKQVKKDYQIIDDKLKSSLKEPYYVPFSRDVENKIASGPKGGTDKFQTTTRGIKRIRGSEKGEKIISIFQNLIEHTNETIVNAVRNDVFSGIIDIVEQSESLKGIVKKLPPKWIKAGTVEHRSEVDKILSPQIAEITKTLGGTQEYKVRMGRKLGLYQPTTDEMRIMFGATEKTKSHELGHVIDTKKRWLKKIVENNNAEMETIASFRYEGQEPDLKFIDYTKLKEEKAAEFVAMYITDRTRLQEVAPNALKQFESRISRDKTLKKLVDMRPSRAQGIEKFTEANWVMDKSIPRDEDVISGFREGKLVHYRVPIELATAVKNLHPAQIPTALRIFTLPAKALRAGAVSMNVDFFIPNVVRDQIDASFHAKNIPGYDYMRGMKHFIAQDDVYKMYMRKGGAMEAPEAGIRKISRSAQELIYGSKRKQVRDPFYWESRGKFKGGMELLGNIISSPFRVISGLAEISEMGTRLGVAGRGLKSGLGKAEAVHAGRQASMDFQRFGSGGIIGGRVPNSIIPFINVAMEGVDRMGRSIKDNPLRVAMAAFVYGIAPTIGLTLWNKENDKYKHVSGRDKANNYIIMKSKTTDEYWKIPKSHAIKLIVNPFQMAWEKALGTSIRGWKDLAVQTIASVSPLEDPTSIAPTTIKLLLEPIANYDYYWAKQIEAPSIQALPAGTRFNKNTSETLKSIGKALNISPIMMQHEVETLFSGAGKHTLLAIDMILGKTKWEDMDESRKPVIRRFNGKAEEWKSDANNYMVKIDKRLAEIEKSSPASLIRYYGYKKENIKEAIKASVEEQRKLYRKKKELIKVKKELDKLISSLE